MKTYLLNPGVRQAIAKAGETGVAVAYNATAWINDYPSGVPQLMVTRPNGQRVPVTVNVADNLITGAVPDDLLVSPGVYSYVFVWTSGAAQLESGKCECMVLGSDLAKTWADVRRAPDWAERIFLAAGVIETTLDGAMAIRNETVDAMHAAEAAQGAAEAAQEAAEDAQEAAEGAQAAAEAVQESIPLDYSEMSDVVEDIHDEFEKTFGTKVFTEFAAGYYNLSNSVTNIDFTAPTVTEEHVCGYFPCTPGDKFVITGRGSSGAKIWAWCKGNGDILSRADNQTLDNVTVTAPDNAAFLVVNFIKAYAYSLKLDKSINVGAELADIRAASGAARLGLDDVNVISESVLETGKIWDVTNGQRTAGSGWVSAKKLVPFTAKEDTALLSTCGYNVNMACYDAQQQYIAMAKAGLLVAGGATSVAVPAGTCYLGLNVHNTSVTAISMRRIPHVDVLETPFTMAAYAESLVTSGEGALSANANYGCAAMAVTPGDKFYTNETILDNFVCVKKDGTVIGNASYVERTTHGRIYTIPNNAVYCLINIQYNKTHGSGYYSAVAHRITKDKKILCIGDSITFLDGQTSSSYDGASLFLGWQKRLTRAGYDVESAGFSGYPYAVSEGHGSIYTEIVTNEYDVSGYDVIILLGGTNDDYYGINVGETPNKYYNPDYDTETMLGALGAIISYIRANNTACKIVLCTVLKSESGDRPYGEAKHYASGIIEMAEYASCRLVDAFREMNVQPYTDGFDEYFYDTTHPNRAGMERLGELMLKEIEGI